MTDQPKPEIGTVAWLRRNALFDCDRCGFIRASVTAEQLRPRDGELLCSTCAANWSDLPPFDPFAEIEARLRLPRLEITEGTPPDVDWEL